MIPFAHRWEGNDTDLCLNERRSDSGQAAFSGALVLSNCSEYA
jgi:hypothetical protein